MPIKITDLPEYVDKVEDAFNKVFTYLSLHHEDAYCIAELSNIIKIEKSFIYKAIKRVIEKNIVFEHKGKALGRAKGKIPNYYYIIKNR